MYYVFTTLRENLHTEVANTVILHPFNIVASVGDLKKAMVKVNPSFDDDELAAAVFAEISGFALNQHDETAARKQLADVIRSQSLSF